MACAISNDDFQSDLRDDSWLKIIGLSSLMFTRVGDGWQVASKSRMNIEGEAQIKIDKSTHVILCEKMKSSSEYFVSIY